MKELIARRAARLLQPGWVVNLGIGIPTLVAKYVDEGVVFLHSENGVLGVGPIHRPAGPTHRRGSRLPVRTTLSRACSQGGEPRGASEHLLTCRDPAVARIASPGHPHGAGRIGEDASGGGDRPQLVR